jgi:hypothetical protein
MDGGNGINVLDTSTFDEMGILWSAEAVDGAIPRGRTWNQGAPPRADQSTRHVQGHAELPHRNPHL